MQSLKSAFEADAVALLSELVGIDSVNPSLVRGAAGEKAIAERLGSRLARSGFTTSMIPADGRPDRPSLVAIGPGPEEQPVVVLNGHLDTVGVAGMPNPFTPRIEGNRLYGRGAADMKGGIAALVIAAERLAASDSPVRPVLALVADEEDMSLGTEAVIAALPTLRVRPAVCLIAEPTGLELARSLRGFGVVKVRFQGRAAHSSQAHLGENAVTHLGRLLHAIDERARQVRQAGGDFMVIAAHGGSTPFVIPDSAECLVELRTTPDSKGADALGEVDSLLAPDWHARADLLFARDGWRLDSTGHAADLAARLGDRLGTGPTFDAPYWMEAPLWQAVCPTLICGPTGGGLHAVDEWVNLDQVRGFTTALLDALMDWTPGAN